MKKRIYLLDLTHENRLGPGSDTMPVQLGMLAAYCLDQLGDRIEIEIFKYTADLEAAVLRAPPFLVAASNYLWNLHLGYQYVRAIRRRFPNVISVFGGPNYPDELDEQESFLRAYPDIDFYVYKDGELPFLALVRFLLDHEGDVGAAKLARIPGVHAVHEGAVHLNPTAPRIKDLTLIPSPYTMGLMDKFFERNLVPTIQTNRGCPFACTFCTEGSSYYTKVFKSSHARKVAEVDYILQRVRLTKTLRITDSNFGMFEEDVELCRYLSDIQERTGYPEYVMCSAGKNRKDRIMECNRLLRGAMRLTASVQSMVPQILENVKRSNIDLDTLILMSEQTSDTDTHSYSEIILALPGDSLDATRFSIKTLMDAGIGNITQHQLALIYGTELNSRATRTTHGMRGMHRPIQRCYGRYSFAGDEFPAVEIEEICVETNTLSYDDYIEARRLYLTVGMFYNDRIFGEIHGLLRLLGLSTYDWVARIHASIPSLPAEIQELYRGFTDDTAGELWPDRDALVRDVSAGIDRYTQGEAGGNLIYKYRSKALVEHFEVMHRTAYAALREYLAERGVECEVAVAEIERFAHHQKHSVFDVEYEHVDTYRYDIPRLVADATLARHGKSLADLEVPTHIEIRHTPKQKAMIQRELSFYGRDIPGLTLLISRFPIKRFYRKATTPSLVGAGCPAVATSSDSR